VARSLKFMVHLVLAKLRWGEHFIPSSQCCSDKTYSIQLAANALNAGQSVLWVG
jgi:hypothetical protein